jgi:hypothetical protein
MNKLSPQNKAEMIDPADILQLYRPDPTNKFKGGEGIETQPTNVSRNSAYDIVSILEQAQKAGMPPVSVRDLADMIMLEGRGDAGANGYDWRNPRTKAFVKQLADANPGNSNGPTFAGAVLDKTETSKRLGIPFAKAWNGTGKIPGTNWGGTEYAQRAKEFKGTSALDHPKNAPFMDFLQRAMEGKLTPQEQRQATIQRLEETGGHMSGLTVDDSDKLKKKLANEFKDDRNVQKLLPYVKPAALMNAVHNLYRENMGVPLKPHGGYYVYENPHNPVSRRSTANERTDAETLVQIPAVRASLEKMLGIEAKSAPPEPSALDKILEALTPAALKPLIKGKP